MGPASRAANGIEETLFSLPQVLWNLQTVNQAGLEAKKLNFRLDNSTVEKVCQSLDTPFDLALLDIHMSANAFKKDRQWGFFLPG